VNIVRVGIERNREDHSPRVPPSRCGSFPLKTKAFAATALAPSQTARHWNASAIIHNQARLEFDKMHF